MGLYVFLFGALLLTVALQEITGYMLTTARSTRNIARRPTTSVCLPLQSGSAKTARSGWHQRIAVSTYTARIPRFPDGKNTRRATNACKQIKCNRF